MLYAYMYAEKTCGSRLRSKISVGKEPPQPNRNGQQNSTNKKPHCVPEEAKLTYNLCGGQQGTERQAEDNRQGADPT